MHELEREKQELEEENNGLKETIDDLSQRFETCLGQDQYDEQIRQQFN